MPDQPNVLWIMSDQHSAKCTSWGEFPTDPVREYAVTDRNYM